MLPNAQRLQELHYWLVLVVAEERVFALAQLNIELIVHMRRVDLPRRHLLVRKLVVAAETELNDTHELPLLLEREVAVLKNLTLAERNADKRRVLLRVEEVVRHVLKLQIRCRARSDQLIH